MPIFDRVYLCRYFTFSPHPKTVLYDCSRSFTPCFPFYDFSINIFGQSSFKHLIFPPLWPCIIFDLHSSVFCRFHTQIPRIFRSFPTYPSMKHAISRDVLGFPTFLSKCCANSCFFSQTAVFSLTPPICPHFPFFHSYILLSLLVPMNPPEHYIV